MTFISSLSHVASLIMNCLNNIRQTKLQKVRSLFCNPILLYSTTFILSCAEKIFYWIFKLFYLLLADWNIQEDFICTENIFLNQNYMISSWIICFKPSKAKNLEVSPILLFLGNNFISPSHISLHSLKDQQLFYDLPFQLVLPCFCNVHLL